MFKYFLSIALLSISYSQNNSQTSIHADSTQFFNRAFENRDLFGLELNPISLYFSTHSSSKNKLYLSFTVSSFSKLRARELSVPILYWSDGSSKILNIGFHYKSFKKNRNDGFFVSGLGRFTILQGYILNIDSNYFFSSDYKTHLRFGLGAGIGYRALTKSGFFWGISIYGGLYFNSADEFDSKLFYTKTAFIDIDILKFGYAF